MKILQTFTIASSNDSTVLETRRRIHEQEAAATRAVMPGAFNWNFGTVATSPGQIAIFESPSWRLPLASANQNVTITPVDEDTDEAQRPAKRQRTI